jgi:hypothetical protein
MTHDDAVRPCRQWQTDLVDWVARSARQRRRCASAIRARPSSVRGPVESPPWNRQRAFPGSGLTRQALPALVLAWHLGRSLRRGRRSPAFQSRGTSSFLRLSHPLGPIIPHDARAHARVLVARACGARLARSIFPFGCENLRKPIRQAIDTSDAPMSTIQGLMKLEIRNCRRAEAYAHTSGFGAGRLPLTKIPRSSNLRRKPMP